MFLVREWSIKSPLMLFQKHLGHFSVSPPCCLGLLPFYPDWFCCCCQKKMLLSLIFLMLLWRSLSRLVSAFHLFYWFSDTFKPQKFILNFRYVGIFKSWDRPGNCLVCLPSWKLGYKVKAWEVFIWRGMRKIKDTIKTVCSLNQHVLPHQTMSYASEC